MNYSGQLCQNLKGAAFYCSGRWVSATARYEVSITNATSSWEQRESYCVLQRTNILYKYECNVGDCEPQAYIGYTRTTLSRRITMHLQSGAPLKHSQDFHNSTLNREQMVSNTSIIRRENDFNRLEIMEALNTQSLK